MRLVFSAPFQFAALFKAQLFGCVGFLSELGQTFCLKILEKVQDDRSEEG